MFKWIEMFLDRNAYMKKCLYGEKFIDRNVYMEKYL